MTRAAETVNPAPTSCPESNPSHRHLRLLASIALPALASITLLACGEKQSRWGNNEAGDGTVVNYEDIAPRQLVQNIQIPERTFFGITAQGNRICFVLDISGSMDNGQRYPLLLTQLRQVLGTFSPAQQFAVILFNSRAAFVEEIQGGTGGWNAATQAVITEKIAFMDSYSPGGGTNWEAGLNKAFQMVPKPDEIYFMTDGDTRSVDSLIDEITARNIATPPLCRIHAIALMQPSAEAAMLTLATRNQGQFVIANEDGTIVKRN